MDDLPEFQSGLKPIGGKDVTYNLWGELVFGRAPQRSKAKLGIGIHGWLLQKTLPRMEELAH